jgi:hypothetical protein
LISHTGRYGHLLLPVSFFLCILVFLSGWANGENASDYGDTLIRRANELKLHDNPEWKTLVHYKKKLRGIRSLIDDPRFFLSPRGKDDPRAELEATIRAFVAQPLPGEKHAACRFIARYHWLREKLAIDENLIPVRGCPDIEEAINRMQPKSVTMAFPASHINSPASMFGHTFLILETGNRSKLLAHAVNYSAITGDTFGMFFSIKSILGLYRGYFSILPYYVKIQEYNDFDQRDIWEYGINFTELEVRRMLYHIYELENIYSHYFFFDENCSYNLLVLLDIARPGLRLSDDYYPPWFSWVIPLDTIRGIRDAGLVDSFEYRPSRVSTIKHLDRILSDPGRELALEVIRKKKEPGAIMESLLDPAEKVRVCDMVTEYARYKYSKNDITKEEYTDFFIKTLSVRSRLASTEDAKYQVPLPVRPEEGHLSARIALGVGMRDSSPFQEVRLRPAYHTIMDNDEGYVDGGHIVFTDMVARFYDREKHLELDHVDVIDIVSLTPNDRFIRSISWKVNTGARRRLFPDGDNHLLGVLNPGGGSAWKVPFLGIIYCMLETEVASGKVLEHNISWGAGASLGALTKITSAWKAHLSVKEMFYFTGEKQHEAVVSLSQRLKTGVNSSLMLELRRTVAAEMKFDEHRGQNEVLLNGNLFF